MFLDSIWPLLMRQDSSVHEACVAELLKSAGIMTTILIYQRMKSGQVLLKELLEDPGFYQQTHAEKSELLERISDFPNGP